ncbi:MAG: hypothetical protein C4583_03350 [Anaerolineaceae bacterium]|nr:MAG: hypothetical protein C4583_03350 [Anaerolineaceae bacterium]
MAGFDLVTAPSIEPITLADFKAHQRVGHSEEDDLIDSYIAAARSACEATLKMSLLYTTWRYRIDFCFPWEIRLPIGPLRTVSGLSIQYVDDAGATQTLATSVYQVSLGDTGVIRPAYGETWPATRPQMDAVTVTFKAGEASAADLRPAIVDAVRLETANRYEHRESQVVGTSSSQITSLSARNLLTPFIRP